jgi:lysozyme
MAMPDTAMSLLLPLVQRFEGCKLQAYQDVAGVWTVGYGHTGADVDSTTVWSQDQADTALQTDLSDHYGQLLAISPKVTAVSPGRQAALIDFVYNLGSGTYQHSTLRSAVDCFAWESVKNQLRLWIHAGGKVQQGLVDRRNAEIALIDQ